MDKYIEILLYDKHDDNIVIEILKTLIDDNDYNRFIKYLSIYPISNYIDILYYIIDNKKYKFIKDVMNHVFVTRNFITELLKTRPQIFEYFAKHKKENTNILTYFFHTCLIVSRYRAMMLCIIYKYFGKSLYEEIKFDIKSYNDYIIFVKVLRKYNIVNKDTSFKHVFTDTFVFGYIISLLMSNTNIFRLKKFAIFNNYNILDAYLNDYNDKAMNTYQYDNATTKIMLKYLDIDTIEYLLSSTLLLGKGKYRIFIRNCCMLTIGLKKFNRYIYTHTFEFLELYLKYASPQVFIKNIYSFEKYLHKIDIAKDIFVPYLSGDTYILNNDSYHNNLDIIYMSIVNPDIKDIRMTFYEQFISTFIDLFSDPYEDDYITFISEYIKKHYENLVINKLLTIRCTYELYNFYTETINKNILWLFLRNGQSLEIIKQIYEDLRDHYDVDDVYHAIIGKNKGVIEFVKELYDGKYNFEISKKIKNKISKKN